jgi:hypothetical protein
MSKLIIIISIASILGCSETEHAVVQTEKARTLFVGKCYIQGSDYRNPFEKLSHACIQDIQGEWVLATEKRFNEFTGEWYCKKESSRIKLFSELYSIETAYKEHELCQPLEAQPEGEKA